MQIWGPFWSLSSLDFRGRQQQNGRHRSKTATFLSKSAKKWPFSSLKTATFLSKSAKKWPFSSPKTGSFLAEKSGRCGFLDRQGRQQENRQHPGTKTATFLPKKCKKVAVFVSRGCDCALLEAGSHGKQLQAPGAKTATFLVVVVSRLPGTTTAEWSAYKSGNQCPEVVCLGLGSILLAGAPLKSVKKTEPRLHGSVCQKLYHRTTISCQKTGAV